jgi:hypothetical protein
LLELADFLAVFQDFRDLDAKLIIDLLPELINLEMNFEQEELLDGELLV